MNAVFFWENGVFSYCTTFFMADELWKKEVVTFVLNFEKRAIPIAFVILKKQESI